MEYTIKRELVQILGEIELQLGELSNPVRGIQSTKMVFISGDIENVISEKYMQLTDIQRHSVAKTMNIRRVSAIN